MHLAVSACLEEVEVEVVVQAGQFREMRKAAAAVVAAEGRLPMHEKSDLKWEAVEEVVVVVEEREREVKRQRR